MKLWACLGDPGKRTPSSGAPVLPGRQLGRGDPDSSPADAPNSEGKAQFPVLPYSHWRKDIRKRGSAIPG